MSLDFLKEGLTPQEKAKITKTFNKQVDEQVKIELTAIVETQVKGLIDELRQKYTKAITEGTKQAQKMTLKEVKKLDRQISKYVTYFVSESLPQELVEKAGQGLRYGKFLDTILEAQKQELKEQAEKDLKLEIDKLKESLNASEAKRKQLFERMVSDANDKVIQTKRMKVDELLKEYPDKYAVPMRKVIKEAIDFASIETKDLKPKVERIFEAVKKTEKSNGRLLTEDQKPTARQGQGRGKSPTRLQESAPADPDVADAIAFMDVTTFNR